MEALDAAHPAISIIDGTAAHLSPTIALCDERYGVGYCTPDVYDTWLHGLLKVALYEGEYAGFAVMLPASVPEVMARMQMAEAEVLAVESRRPLLIYKSAAVLQRYERRGIMTAMAQAGLREARERGYGTLFGSAWIHDGQVPIAGTFRRFGFQPLFERKRLWYQDENYHCVVCGGRCVCDGIIYCKTL